MATFGPLIRNQLPPLTVHTSGLARRMFRHKSAEPQGINVWILTDGTAQEYQPQATYSSAGVLTAEGSARVTRFLQGAIAHTVTAAEATILTTAGYGSVIT